MKFRLLLTMFLFQSGLQSLAQLEQSCDTIFQISCGKICRFSNVQSTFVESRTIDVWIPNDYSTKKKYDVLYMQDGQNLFDTSITKAFTKAEWKVDEATCALNELNAIRDCIVVGIYNTSHRRPDYFPAKAFASLDSTVQNKISADIKGIPCSDDYLKFVVTELKPFVDHHFSTSKRRASTHIAGSSMGGLISLYAICEYPKTFGSAACISTHWVGCPNYRNDAIPLSFIQYIQNNLPSERTHRIYFDYGTENLDAEYEKWQKQADDVMKNNGYNPWNWSTHKFIGEGHSEISWSKRMNSILVFLLGK